jgi:hypothetical protein
MSYVVVLFLLGPISGYISLSTQCPSRDGDSAEHACDKDRPKITINTTPHGQSEIQADKILRFPPSPR